MNGPIRSWGSSLFSIFFSFSTFVSLCLLMVHVESKVFNFDTFTTNTANMKFENDSTPADGAIQLTKNVVDGKLTSSVGRASYSQPVRLWDKSSNKMTDFITYFTFDIRQVGDYLNFYGDGIAFFLAPFNDATAYAPQNSFGGCLGLVGGDDKSCNVTSEYPFVAVEFDAYENSWDPDSDHLGIDVTSVVSEAEFEVNSVDIYGLKNKTTAHAWITYDSATNNLSVFLTYDAYFVFRGESNLSHIIDLSSILPETVRVGFSAATGENSELHTIRSWYFNSTLADPIISVPASPQNLTITEPSVGKGPSKSKVALLLVGVLVATIIIISLAGVMFMRWRRRSGGGNDNIHFDVGDDFDQETGPKRFTYNELSCATNNFHEEGKLGEGGFGGVYRGFSTGLSREIAVKKISKGSKQGKKEYVSEVKTISRLRHKNLVQLLGWCHEQGNLLLVYEYMPNGSLDYHLYAGKKEVVLPWAVRYKIAQDLASALLYLHQEWEQCVLHRDIKSSNVMLDSNFNAKLGDFGLARLVDHNLGSQTTVLAGTLGYLAPECVMTGKSSKESDVYSYGVVALEIACGRQPVASGEEPGKVSLIEWVWHLYGEGRLLEATDKQLAEEFNVQQIECLMVVGLWCCHPDHTCRPSIRQVISVLNFESPLPIKLPVPIYCSPDINMSSFYITPSSSGLTNSSGVTSSSSQSILSGSAPLLSADNARAR